MNQNDIIAARIFLKITDVRIERLQDISVIDAKNEGIRVHSNGCANGLSLGCYNGDECFHNRCTQPITYFSELWDSITKKQEFKWKENPYVWVYKFKGIKNREVEE